MKQMPHILTDILYMPLHDPAWKITSTRIENNCRVVATIEPKKRRRLTCSKCGALAIPHSYTQREHHALHQVLPMTGHRVYVCVKQPLIHCRSVVDNGVLSSLAITWETPNQAITNLHFSIMSQHEL